MGGGHKAANQKGSVRAQEDDPNERETSTGGALDGGKGGHARKVSLGVDRGGRRGWIKQKSRQEDRLRRFRTGVEAKEERGNESGSRRARSKKAREEWERETRRGGKPASTWRRSVGEERRQPETTLQPAR